MPLRIERLRCGLLAAACALVLASCEAADPAGSSDSLPPPSAPPPPSNLPPPTQLSDAELEALLVQEKARLDQRKQQSQAVYDSLKTVWQAFLDDDRTLPPSVLLRCDPVQYVGEAKIIGPDGGDIDFGSHKLRIPAGALAGRTVITAEAPTSLEVAVELHPSGISFLVPLELDLKYKHCAAAAQFSPLRGAWVNDSGQILEFPSSRDNRGDGKVEVWLDHFSKYAVAY